MYDDQIAQSPYYVNAVAKAKSHDMVYHYTTIETLEKILASKALRLSRLDKVNDLDEQKWLMKNYQSKVYAACFTHEKRESIPLWKLYARGHLGVRVGINLNRMTFHTVNDPFGNELTQNSEWKRSDTSVLDVLYDDDKQKYSHDDLNQCQGFLKSTAWEYEQETRIRILIDYHIRDFGGMKNYVKLNGTYIEYYIPPFDYISLMIDTFVLQKIDVVCNPWISEGEKEELEKMISEYVSGYSGNIEHSILRNRISQYWGK